MAERKMRSLEDLIGIPAPANDEIDDFAEIVADYNSRFAVVVHGGKFRVLRNRDDGFDLMTTRDFHDLCATDRIWLTDPKDKTGERKLLKATSPIWFQHKDRRFYNGIILDPRPDAPEDAFNLWRGFSVRPSARGSCDLFLAHLLDNVCGGDKALYRWLVGWMAHLIQRPWLKPGTALVLKGKYGVGKTIVGETLGVLIADHVVTVEDSRGLLGNFNAHLATAALVLVEEAIWSGDRSAEGKLRGMITAPTMSLERKGVDAMQVESFHRFIVTSNEHWAVPAREGERRYAIFNVGDAHMQDRAYFGAIKDQLQAGGYRALMKHLMDFDLSGIDVHTIPKTAALAETQTTGLYNINAWWHDALSAGRIDDLIDREAWEDRRAIVRAVYLRNDYEAWIRARKHHGDVLSNAEFGRRITELCSMLKHTRRRFNGKLEYAYQIPTLTTARQCFEGWLQNSLDWD